MAVRRDRRRVNHDLEVKLKDADLKLVDISESSDYVLYEFAASDVANVLCWCTNTCSLMSHAKFVCTLQHVCSCFP
jgi:hypothetical protein